MLAQATFEEQFSDILYADPTARLMVVKRTIDVVLTAVTLLLLLPLFAILAVLIKLSIPGSVFSRSSARQRRRRSDGALSSRPPSRSGDVRRRVILT